MKILFTKQQPLDAPGGETSHLFALAREMQQMGVEVHLMPVTDHPTPQGIWNPQLIHEVKPFGMHHTLDSMPLSRAAANFAQSTPVDAVLSWQYETAYLSEFLPQRNFVHGVVAAAPFGWLKRKADTSLSRRIAYHFFHFRQLYKADVIYAASQFARDELIQQVGIAPEKIVVIPIGVDEIFQPAREVKHSALQNFIFSGSLEEIKGIFDALEALAIIYRRGYRNWNLSIAGWGDPSAVREFAAQRGIAECIEFLGVLDRPALAAELARADLAILPSHTETFGLAIAEAQACALPVVSYRTGGIPEVVQNEVTALLADLFNHQQLADAIIHLIENPSSAREMGRRGAELIRENFSWKKTAQLLIDNIAQIKSGNHYG